MHSVVPLKVLYFGTPVVLVSTCNEDGTTNLAPMSSAWWLGQHAMIGMSDASQTARNLLREGECVLNLVPSSLASSVDRMALTTGSAEVPAYKARMGYRHVHDKFAVSGLTAQRSQLVRPGRVAECPIQLECTVASVASFGGEDATATAFELEVLRAHVADEVQVPGTAHVDTDAWDPLIMKFCEFFGDAANLRSSRLAAAWHIPRSAKECGRLASTA